MIFYFYPNINNIIIKLQFYQLKSRPLKFKGRLDTDGEKSHFFWFLRFSIFFFTFFQ